MNRRISWLVVAASLLVLASARPALAKLEGSQWTEAERKFKALFAVAGDPDAKIDAAKVFIAETDPRAFRLIAEGVVQVTGYAAKAAEKLKVAFDRLQVLYGIDPKKDANAGGLSTEMQAEMFKLQEEVSALEKQKSEEQRVATALLGMATQGAEGFRKEIIKATHAHADWFQRTAAARIAASAPEEEASKPALIELIEKEKDPRVRLAGVEGLAKAPGNSWHTLIAGRCEDPDWSVQLVAARIAGEREVGRAIPNLIHGLAKATPRVAEAIVTSLRKLTGQNIEAYEEPWAKWWEANRSKYGEDGRPLQPVVAAPRASDVEFYGLKVRSDKIMYIIDISGSMQAEKKAKATTGRDTPGKKPDPRPDAHAERFSGPKIEIAKLELKRSLQALPKTSSFNIIAFNHQVQQWKEKMVDASDANKEQAYAWIRDMTPSGSTFIDGALQIAFKMAGMGAYDKAYPGVALDTIILLSDGAPTDNSDSGTLMDPKIILDHVAEWNPQKRIVIHCIGIDNVVQGIDFMKKLASQNGGIYIDG